MRQHEFTASDVHSETHKYETLPHPAGEGLALLSELMAIGSSGLKGALGAMRFDAVAAAAQKGDTSMLDGIDIDEAMLGAAIGQVMQALGQRDVIDLCKRLLTYTSRDGKPMQGSKLSNAAATAYSFDAVYAANYGELRTALVEVCRFNFASFFGGLGRVGVLRKLAQTPTQA